MPLEEYGGPIYTTAAEPVQPGAPPFFFKALEFCLADRHGAEYTSLGMISFFKCVSVRTILSGLKEPAEMDKQILSV